MILDCGRIKWCEIIYCMHSSLIHYKWRERTIWISKLTWWRVWLIVTSSFVRIRCGSFILLITSYITILISINTFSEYSSETSSNSQSFFQLTVLFFYVSVILFTENNHVNTQVFLFKKDGQNCSHGIAICGAPNINKRLFFSTTDIWSR